MVKLNHFGQIDSRRQNTREEDLTFSRSLVVMIKPSFLACFSLSNMENSSSGFYFVNKRLKNSFLGLIIEHEELCVIQVKRFKYRILHGMISVDKSILKLYPSESFILTHCAQDTNWTYISSGRLLNALYTVFPIISAGSQISTTLTWKCGTY